MNQEQTCCCTKKQHPTLLLRIIFLLLGCLMAYVLVGTNIDAILRGTQISNNIWIIFLLGLVASVSTCLAITGGVIVAYTDLTVDEHDSNIILWRHQFFLHIGRIVGFIVLGGILGLVGQQVSYSLGFTTWLNGIVALFLLGLGLNILGILPSWKLDIPASNNLHALGAYREKKNRVTVVFGALTFFIPCGFTQMVQLMALASGSWLLGAMMMGVFALGTFPGLLLLGVGTSFAKASHKKYFERGIAVVLIAFSLYSLWGTFTLSGVKDALHNRVTITEKNSQNNVREKINILHNGLHLVPRDILLEAGKNYKIIVEPENDGIGCMSSIALPAIDRNIYPVVDGESILYTIENAQPGQYTFVCSSMGMEQGKIIVQ